MQADGDPCDAWWWEDEYASYITGAGINLLIAAAGGNFMIRHPEGGGRELMQTVSGTWALCVFLIVAQALRMVQDRL